MSNLSLPKVTIIVPVYNVEAYLPKCLDSILAQTFTDFEILLVNDGSLDCSGRICDKYAKADARIRVFHQANAGVSVARNTGLDNAKGEWLAFVDSDDWVEPNWLDTFVDEGWSKLTNTHLMFFGRRNLKENEIVYEFTPSNECWDAQTILNSNEFYYIALWSCFFRRDIINFYYIRFSPGMKVAEDTEFLLKAFSVSEVIIGLKCVLYNYVIRAESATRTIKRDFSRASMDIVAVNEFLEFCIKNNIPTANLYNCILRSYRIFLRVYLLGVGPKHHDKRRFVELYNVTCKRNIKFKRNLFWRFIVCMWMLGLHLTRIIMVVNRSIKSGYQK